MTKKMLFKVLKLFGFTVTVLLLILVIGITAILLFDNNNLFNYFQT